MRWRKCTGVYQKPIKKKALSIVRHALMFLILNALPRSENLTVRAFAKIVLLSL